MIVFSSTWVCDCFLPEWGRAFLLPGQLSVSLLLEWWDGSQPALPIRLAHECVWWVLPHPWFLHVSYQFWFDHCLRMCSSMPLSPWIFESIQCVEAHKLLYGVLIVPTMYLEVFLRSCGNERLWDLLHVTLMLNNSWSTGKQSNDLQDEVFINMVHFLVDTSIYCVWQNTVYWASRAFVT